MRAPRKTVSAPLTASAIALRIAYDLSVGLDDTFVSATPEKQPFFGRSCSEHSVWFRD